MGFRVWGLGFRGGKFVAWAEGVARFQFISVLGFIEATKSHVAKVSPDAMMCQVVSASETFRV